MRKIFTLLILILTITSASGTALAVDLGDIVGPDVVYKENNEIVGITDIISLYSSVGGIIYADEDEYTNNGHILGDHRVLLKTTDGITEKSKEINVKVTVNKIPDVMVGEVSENAFKLVGISSTKYYFYTTNTKTITSELIAETLMNLGHLNIVKPMQRQILEDEYTENKSEAGTYSYVFRILDASGSIKNITSSIYVIEVSDWDDFIPDTPSGFFNFDFSAVWGIVTTILGLAIVIVIVYLSVKFVKKFTRKYNK